MAARERCSSLVCSVLLGVLLISCGAPSSSGAAPAPGAGSVPGDAAPPAGPDGAVPAPEGGLAAVPEAAVEGGDAGEPGARQVGVAGEPAAPEGGGVPGPPEGGVAAAPDPARNGGAPGAPGGVVPGRPRGLPPGVGHDLPDLSSDLAQKDQWRERLDSRCREAGVEPGCLKLDVTAFEVDASGNRTQIPEPSTNYREDDTRYGECTVDDMDPLSPADGGPEKVPAGTTIKVTVVCTLNAPDEANPPGDG